MTLPQFVNRLLAPFDVAVTRRTTLDRTRAQWRNALQQAEDRQAAAQQVRASPEPAASLANESLAEAATRIETRLLQSHHELIRHQIAVQWSIADMVERRTRVDTNSRRCPLCQHSEHARGFKVYETQCLFGGGQLVRHQCPRCDVIFGADKMFALSEKELSQEYEWHYKVFQEGDSTDVEMRAFHSLEPRRDAVYVNFGAGAWSSSVERLRDEGWQVFAYEPHSSASRAQPWVINDEAGVAALRPDGIYSNNVLEHFRHPVSELRKIASWLKPGGLMAHATPCYEYLFEYTRFHLFFFPGRSREVLATLAGCAIRKFEVDGVYMNCVLEPLPT